MIKQKPKTKFDVEKFLINNVDQLPILQEFINEIEINRKEDSDFKPDTLEEIGLLLKNDGFFLDGNLDYYLYQFDGNKINKYQLNSLARYLEESKGFDEDLLELTVRCDNIMIIVKDLPKIRRIDLRLWKVLIERDLTVKKAVREFKRYKKD